MSRKDDKAKLLNNAKLLVQVRRKRESFVASELRVRLRDMETGRDASSFRYELDRALSAATKRVLDKLLGDVNSYSKREGELTQAVEKYVTDAVTEKLASLLPSDKEIELIVKQSIDSVVARVIQRKMESLVDAYVTTVCGNGLLKELEEAEQEARALLESEEATKT